MAYKRLIPEKSVSYFFLKSKDEYIEDGLISVTLFARLTRQITSFTGRKIQIQVETFWVQINDIRMAYLTEKVKELPNCIEKYEISEPVFQHLLKLSESCPNELQILIPVYLKANREMFLTCQELDDAWKASEKERR